MSKTTILNLDLDAEETINFANDSLIGHAIQEGVENDKCVVPQYRTTIEQVETLKDHLKTCTLDKVPIEWVIDIADETNGWFYGTAYHYDDTTHLLHVMVPDKLNPTFDGNVLLDYRTVHLIECVDGKSEALFNKIIRDSIVKVKWDVEWYEEDQANATGNEGSTGASWISSSARYFIRIANQMLVIDDEFAEGTKGYVMLNADVSLRLLRCHKGKGLDDFTRLIREGIVSCSTEALEMTNTNESPKRETAKDASFRSPNAVTSADPVTPSNVVSAKKLLDTNNSLKECLEDLLDERENTTKELEKISKKFHAFAMNGDVQAGLELLDSFAGIQERKGRITCFRREDDGKDTEIDGGVAADEAWYLIQKLEKSLMKLNKAGPGTGDFVAVSPNVGSEATIVEYEKTIKKLKKELAVKEKELAGR